MTLNPIATAIESLDGDDAPGSPAAVENAIVEPGAVQSA
jgi:hypothetical protein